MNKIVINSKKYGSKEILIDKEDFFILSEYKLRLKYDKGKFYVFCRHKGKEPSVPITNIILKDTFIDHINGNTLDNRKSNLRKSNYNTNNRNAKKRKDYKDSKFKGVKKCGKRWTCRIQFNKNRIIIGYFDTEIEAAKAYDKKAKELHGEFAWLNFP